LRTFWYFIFLDLEEYYIITLYRVAFVSIYSITPSGGPLSQDLCRTSRKNPEKDPVVKELCRNEWYNDLWVAFCIVVYNRVSALLCHYIILVVWDYWIGVLCRTSRKDPEKDPVVKELCRNEWYNDLRVAFCIVVYNRVSALLCHYIILVVWDYWIGFYCEKSRKDPEKDPVVKDLCRNEWHNDLRVAFCVKYLLNVFIGGSQKEIILLGSQ